ncbi:hypothetical protein ACU1JV_00300 [Paenibacillus sp. T2-29]
MGNISIEIRDSKVFMKTNEPMFNLRYAYREHSKDEYRIKIDTEFKEHSVEDLKKLYEIQVENYMSCKLDSINDEKSLMLSATILKIQKFLIQILDETSFDLYNKDVIEYFLKYNSCKKLYEVNKEEILKLEQECDTIKNTIESIKSGRLIDEFKGVFLMSFNSSVEELEKDIKSIYKVINRYHTFIEISNNFNNVVEQDYKQILL